MDQTHIADELVENQLLSDEVSRNSRLPPRHADQPRQRRERMTDERLQVQLKISKPGHDPTDHAIEQGDQADESNQHGADIDRSRRHRGVGVRHFP